MARPALGSVVQQVGALFEVGSAAGLSDRQLLERYNAGGRDSAGEAAFAAVVGRHGPMVLGICRQILGDVQHAEDVFQAVFIVLAQKARSIRDPDLLGNWLYGVANRMARRARQQVARRRRAEGDTMGVSGMGTCASAEPTADRPAIDREQAEALHSEIARLPRLLSLAGGALLFRGPDPRRGRAPPAMPGRDRAQPVGPGASAGYSEHSPVAGWSCPQPHWPRPWALAQPRRASHPPCV